MGAGKSGWFVVALCAVALVGATGCTTVTGKLGTVIMARNDKRQVAEQWSDAHVGLKQPLDFAPFEQALTALSPERVRELDALLLNATALDMQGMMEAGTLTSEALTLYYLDRIRRYDGTYNTVLELNPEALQLARALDVERAAGDPRGPLHGVPILLKDNIGTGDEMHNTAGAAAMAGARAGRDSFIAAQLREAGAVFLGKNNLSEWANFMTSDSVNGFSALGGPTRNAHGRYDVSGSSSGTASAVALRFAAAGVGSETVGSVIAPGSRNSVAGLRPTLGLISGDLIIPITHKLDSAGPIARTVTDLAVLLGPLSALDAADPFSPRAGGLRGQDFTGSLDAAALRGKRAGLVSLGSETSEELEMAASLLRNAGAEVVDAPVNPADLEGLDALPVLAYGLREDVNAYLAETDAPVASLEAIIAFNAADLEARAPYGQDYLEMAQASRMTAGEYDAAAEELRATTAALIRRLMTETGADVLVGIGNSVSMLYAPAGAPALTVPAGASNDGQPFGVTFFAMPGSDPALIGYGYAFEQANDARLEPVPVEP